MGASVTVCDGVVSGIGDLACAGEVGEVGDLGDDGDGASGFSSSSRVAVSVSVSNNLAESCFSMLAESALFRLDMCSDARPMPISLGKEFGNRECRVRDCLAVERPESGIGTAFGVGRLSFMASNILARSTLASE